MAALLHVHRAPSSIMPIDTFCTISSSPPISFLTAAASTYSTYLRSTNMTTHESNLAFSTSSSGLSLHDVNCLNHGMFPNSIKPYNSKYSIIPTPKKKNSQPLRSCLRVKQEVRNGDNESLNPAATLTDPTCPTSDLEEQMDRLRINEHIRTGNSTKEEKKVVFADSKGLPLASVKFLDGPSELPPVLSEALLKHIIQDAKPEPDHPFNYITDFEQPASNYLEFRERVEHNFVSLENVIIKDNIKVMGTIKVKNVAFEKDIRLRVTYDEWRTYKDIPTTFVPQSNVSTSRYDTFAFDFDIPPNQGGKQFEFCINYKASGAEYWDNNQGNNYQIVSQERRVMTQQQKIASYYSSVGGHDSWGEFSFWKSASEDEVPYW